ncbi:MAG: hypothetical protein ABIZ07_05765 [Dermatophilaceae bacterium]
MNSVTPYILALLPTVGIGALFYVIMKNILEADRSERLAQAKWEAEQDRQAERAERAEDLPNT